MKIRNTRRYRCDECRALMFFSKREENRAARLRCTACGSARLVMSADGAARQAEANDARASAAENVEQRGRGDVLP